MVLVSTRHPEHPLQVNASLVGAKSTFVCWPAGFSRMYLYPGEGGRHCGLVGQHRKIFCPRVIFSANPLLTDSHVRAPCSWGGRMGENSSQKKQICVVAG